MELIITCEHALNKVPRKFEPIFANKQKLLNSHEGWDIGALSLAKKIAKACCCPLFTGSVSRLLIELNRSLHNPSLFSKLTKPLPEAEKQKIINTYYHPFRDDVIDLVDLLILEKIDVVHVSIHTFTEKLNGKKRDFDIGLLFDPQHNLEKQFCGEFKKLLQMNDKNLKIRYNKPYKGTNDGFVTALRKRYPECHYLGIELEVNQKFPLGDKKGWETLQRDISDTLKNLFL